MVLNRVAPKLVIDTSFDMYEKHMLPLAYDSGTSEFTAVMVDCLSNEPAGF